MTNLIFSAFALGNAAILTNACLLPLYPGLMAFLAGGIEQNRRRRVTAVLGALVLAGILTTMLALGLLLTSIAALLLIILPLVYAVVIALGILMVLGRNPFAKMATAQSPVLRNPFVTAYIYGLLFGPMTLPCTGPIVATAFLYGVGGAASLTDGVVYFLAFGFGFGWPLVVLPLLAIPFQQRMVRWLAERQMIISRASGVLMIAVGIFGVITELLIPHVQLFRNINFDSGMWFVYWGTVMLIIALVVIVSLRRNASRLAPPTSGTPAHQE